MLLESFRRSLTGQIHTLAVVALFALAGCGTDSSDPVASAGVDQVANEGALVQLDASSSRGAGTVTYEWRQVSGPNVTLLNSTSATPEFTAPQVDMRTDLVFRVLVRFKSDSSPAETVVTVNDSPVALANDDLIVDGTSAVLLDGGLSSDSDGAISSFAWTQIEGSPVNLDTPDEFTASFFAPDVEVAETLVFTLTVTDNDGATASSNVEVLVRPRILPVVIGNDVEFDPPEPLSNNDLLALPTGSLGRPLLLENSRLSAVVSLDDRDELEGLARCLSLVQACVSPPDRTIDDCMRSAPVCETETGWDEDDACCPDSCFASYEAQRLNGFATDDAFMETFFSSSSCFSAVRDLEDQL